MGSLKLSCLLFVSLVLLDICSPIDAADAICTGANEEHLPCGPVCQETCAQQERCLAIACDNTTCYCKNGFKRNDQDVCVPASQCDPACENPNETYMRCGPNCEKTCENLDKRCNNRLILCRAGCFCNKGYARNAQNFCIPIKQCRKKNSACKAC